MSSVVAAGRRGGVGALQLGGWLACALSRLTCYAGYPTIPNRNSARFSAMSRARLARTGRPAFINVRGMTGVISGIRGAIQIDADLRELVIEGTRELMDAVLTRNHIGVEDIISVLFTVTPDLCSAFPATAAREMGLHEVPLMCATEIDVPGAPPRMIRLLAHVESSLARSAVQHVYLRGAAVLRPDLALPGLPN